ncbi:amino acid ABC transporter membrane protein, PAAT family (TC 3.A.1.3.-) [Cetobacterium ceti]|uniref:Amino acid ABC transporter membrane protein, PAAT family (TC 3.A.1.3.-) n=1 Tax=Cetobacterium ceti TaxID=180163 RepID=A0A1T4LLI2_9FUSO|nr:amino acid ABC transporter permease [Cetobacterium ceti]SJZ55590.1 amino acid ABC transporter membrane protein, PAAT family (TC 3.A.1.3.-) [Cetobacterium ceti]
MNRIKKYFLLDNEKDKISKNINLFNIILVFLLFGGVLYFSFSRLDYTYRWKDTIIAYREKFWIGFWMTVNISFFSLIASVTVGTITAFFTKSKILFLRYMSKFYIEIIRGTPLIVQIYIFFYVIGTAVDIENRYVMGILIMSLFSGAYVSEIVRAGIESIDKSQYETAKALGLNKIQLYRYIVIPQLMKRIMPPLAGQFASLIKDSSLLSIIAVNEFTKNVQEVDSLTFAPIENYLVLALGYIILTYPISYFSKRLERKFAYES